jgi:hypothetical protein
MSGEPICERCGNERTVGGYGTDERFPCPVCRPMTRKGAAVAKEHDYAVGRGTGPWEGQYIVLQVGLPGMESQEVALRAVSEMCDENATLIAANDHDEALVTYGYTLAMRREAAIVEAAETLADEVEADDEGLTREEALEQFLPEVLDVVVADAATEPWGQQIGKQPMRIHAAVVCAGRPCPFHAPSDHPLKDAPINVRFDKHALVERFCEHGVGHDDPDSVAWLHSIGETWAGVHGCDGCCVSADR